MAVDSATPWQVGAGSVINASLADPPGVGTMGARVEVPGTRAIASYYRLAALQGDPPVWTLQIPAPATPGVYELVWRDNDGLGPGGDPVFEAFFPLVVVAPSDLDALGDIPVEYPPVDSDEVTPDVSEVAALLRSRTVDAGGTNVGTFTADTEPSAAEVQAIIDQAVDDVLVRLPTQNISPRHYRQVRRAVTLHAAVLVEGSYFSQEQQQSRSIDLWSGIIDNIVSAVSTSIQAELDEQQATGGINPGRVLV